MKFYFVFNPAAGQGPKGKLFLENYNKKFFLNSFSKKDVYVIVDYVIDLRLQSPNGEMAEWLKAAPC